jgi:hypothetical protein
MASNKAFLIGDTAVEPGQRANISLPVADLYTSTSLSMSVQVACGRF